MHCRTAARESLAHGPEPVAVGRLVVVVGIDRVLRFLAGQAADVHYLAVRGLEVDPLNKIAIHGARPAEVRRAAKEGHLRPARLHGEIELEPAGERPCPWTGGQDHRAARVAPFTGVYRHECALFPRARP